jgi:N-acetylglutamate synthase-like GNAT family acetyltransferase
MFIRSYAETDFPAVLSIINEAAEAYRGVIPDDRWHEPYMQAHELSSEIASGVTFSVVEESGQLVGVMGIQDKGDVALVRHAYVTTAMQGRGVGTALLRHVEASVTKPILVGTWAAASWAIGFYMRNGYTIISQEAKEELLRTYWSIPARQIETSVVLASSRWSAGG